MQPRHRFDQGEAESGSRLAACWVESPETAAGLGLVLGGLLDKSLRRGLVLSDGSLEPFFTRPISMGFATVTMLILLLYIPAFKSLLGAITGTVSRQMRRLISRQA